MTNLIQTVLLTMQQLRADTDKWVMDLEESSFGIDPEDECSCGQCRARAELQDLFYELRRRHL